MTPREQDELTEITAAELQRLCLDHDALAIDVREVGEVPFLHPDKYHQRPMSEIEALLKEDIRQKDIILICQHGIRSLAAAASLKKKYGSAKNIYSLKGGIVRWPGLLSF